MISAGCVGADDGGDIGSVVGDGNTVVGCVWDESSSSNVIPSCFWELDVAKSEVRLRRWLDDDDDDDDNDDDDDDIARFVCKVREENIKGMCHQQRRRRRLVLVVWNRNMMLDL